MASLGRFTATRVMAGALGLLSVVLLARWMAVAEFATYSVLLAAVTVSSIVGSLGLDRVLYREVPLAHMARAHGQIWKLVTLAFGARILVAPATAAALTIATLPVKASISPAVAGLFGAGLALTLVATDIFGVAANALLRFEMQARLSITAMTVKLSLALAVYKLTASLTVFDVVIIALAVEVAQSMALSLMAVRPALRSTCAQVAEHAYDAPSVAAVSRTALTNYGAYLLSLPWQGAAATLIVGAIAPSAAALALFALLQNLLDRMRQYLPLQLLQTAFEPLLVRRYAERGDRAEVANQLELLRRANFCVLVGAAAASLACGDELIALVTGGKYIGGGVLAAIMCFSLALRGISGVQFISANVMGEMSLLTRIYAVVTLAMLPALWGAAQYFAGVGVVLTSILPSVLLWMTMLRRKARSAIGLWHFGKDVTSVTAGIAAAGVGWSVLHWTGGRAGMVASLATTLILYLVALTGLRVFDANDRSALRAGIGTH